MQIISKSLTSGILAMTMIMTAPTASMALGKREKNVLAAIGGVAVIGAIAKNANRSQQTAPQYTHERQIARDLTYKVGHVQNAFRGMNVNSRMRAQQNLSAMGLYTGRIDGAWGRGTEKAFSLLLLDSAGNFDMVRDHRTASMFVNQVVAVR